MQHCETPDVYFVDDRSVPRSSGRRIRAPCECWIDDNAFHHSRRAVATIEGKIFIAMTNPITEMRVMPVHPILNLLCIGVQQKLIAIKTKTFCRIVRPVNPVSVNQAWPRLG